MNGIGVVFNIDDLGGGFYGNKVWHIFMSNIKPETIIGCILKQGDTEQTLYGNQREFCIGVFGLLLNESVVRKAFEKCNEKGLAPLARRFISNPESEPLVEYGSIDAQGRLVQEEWSRNTHDQCKDCNWGFAPKTVTVDLNLTLKSELEKMQKKSWSIVPPKEPVEVAANDNIDIAEPKTNKLASIPAEVLKQQLTSERANYSESALALTGDELEQKNIIMRICSNCGYENTDTAESCSKCGEVLTSVEFKTNNLKSASSDIENEYIKVNIKYYKRKFEFMRSKNKLSWNWSAFFFTTYWLVYRKFYGFATGMLLVSLFLNVLNLAGEGYFYTFIFIVFSRICIGIIGNDLYMDRMTEFIKDNQTVEEFNKTRKFKKNSGVNIAATVMLLTIMLAINIFLLIHYSY